MTTPPSAHSPPIAATDEGPPVARLTAAEARERVAAGRGVLVDTRDARLFDNAHIAGALSLPLAAIEAAHGRLPVGALPPDRVSTRPCARISERTRDRAARLLMAAGYDEHTVAAIS